MVTVHRDDITDIQYLHFLRHPLPTHTPSFLATRFSNHLPHSHCTYNRPHITYHPPYVPIHAPLTAPRLPATQNAPRDQNNSPAHHHNNV